MSAPELKPCPFCGGNAERHTLPGDEFGNEGGDVIECGQCGASSHVEFGRKENLVSMWNRRADLPPTVAAALALPEIAAMVALSREVARKKVDGGETTQPEWFWRDRLFWLREQADYALAALTPPAQKEGE